MMNYQIFFRPLKVYHSKISVSTHGLSNVICCDAWFEIWTLNVRDFPYLQTTYLSYAFCITLGGSSNNTKSLLYEWPRVNVWLSIAIILDIVNIYIRFYFCLQKQKRLVTSNFAIVQYCLMLETLLCVVIGLQQRWDEVKVMLNFRYVSWRERCTFPTFKNLQNVYIICYAAIIQRVNTIWIILELTRVCFRSHKWEVRLIAQQMKEVDLQILFLVVKTIIPWVVWCQSQILRQNLHNSRYMTCKMSLRIDLSISGTILFKFIFVFFVIY